MPLLLIDPQPGPPPVESEVLIAPGEGGVISVRRGQLLSVEAPDGEQVAALFAWTAADPSEWLSPHHTRVFGGSFVLRMGTRLVTNRRRPMFVVGRDSLRRHDLLLPVSEDGLAAVRHALDRDDVVVPRVPDPVNLFLDAPLSANGSINVRPCPARPGERWTVRVLIDSTVAVAAAPTGVPEASARPPRAVRVAVVNEVASLPRDLPVYAGSSHTTT